MPTRRLTPHPQLRPYVRLLSAYDETVPTGEHVGLPGPGLTLVVAPDRPLDLSSPGAGRRTLATCVAGLDDRPSTIHTREREHGLFAELTPLGVRRLLGRPAAELAGRAVTLGDLIGERTEERLLDRLRTATDADRPGLLQDALREALTTHEDRREVPAPLRRAYAVLARSGGTARIGDVAAEVGWSDRYLTRAFRAELGTTPKTLARLVRFARAVPLVTADVPLAEVAVRCGYADQAHLTREWTALAGMPPTRWRRHDVFEAGNLQDR